MIRIRHEPLPAGLSAVVRRRPGGDADVVVSSVLSPARQRAAVRVGLRAARPPGMRAALPVPLAGVLALAWAAARAIARGLRVHLAALVAVAGVVTAAVVVVAVVPHLHGTPGGGQPAGGVTAPAPLPRHSAGQPGQGTTPVTGESPTARPSVVPVADRSPAVAGNGPAPSPGTSATGPGASPTAPTPQPSPSPSAGGGVCVYLLGIRVCL